MSARRRRNLEAVEEGRFLGWIWKACGLMGRPPSSLQRFEPEHWQMLDEARPLVIGWSRVLITCEVLHVRQALWDSDQDSPIVDVFDSMKNGVAIVCEMTQQNPKGLLVLYHDTAEIDVLSLDTDDPVTIIHPGWKVSCERLMPASK